MTDLPNSVRLYDGTFTFTPNCAAGPVSLILDPGNEVDEGDETNNEYTDAHNFTCVPAAMNLWMALFQSSAGREVAAGREIRFTVDVYSVRGDPRNIPVRCGVVGGPILYENTFANLEVLEIDAVRRGARIRFDNTFCPANQLNRVFCEVDPANTIIESDDTDNRIEMELRTVENPSYSCP